MTTITRVIEMHDVYSDYFVTTDFRSLSITYIIHMCYKMPCM